MAKAGYEKDRAVKAVFCDLNDAAARDCETLCSAAESVACARERAAEWDVHALAAAPRSVARGAIAERRRIASMVVQQGNSAKKSRARRATGSARGKPRRVRGSGGGEHGRGDSRRGSGRAAKAKPGALHRARGEGARHGGGAHARGESGARAVLRATRASLNPEAAEWSPAVGVVPPSGGL